MLILHPSLYYAHAQLKLKTEEDTQYVLKQPYKSGKL